MIIDIALLLFTLAGFWVGYTKGIVSTLFSILGYIIALLITLKISPWFSDFLISSFNIEKMFALIFGTLFILIVLIFLIRWLLKKVTAYLEQSKVSAANKVFAGLIMACMGILFFSLVLWPINQFGMIGDQSKQSSISYETLKGIPVKARNVIEKFKPLFNRYWELMQQTIDEGNSKPAE
jgi:membrane protein required for colicin V production